MQPREFQVWTCRYRASWCNTTNTLKLIIVATNIDSNTHSYLTWANKEIPAETTVANGSRIYIQTMARQSKIGQDVGMTAPADRKRQCMFEKISLVSELGLLGLKTSVVVACGLSICGSWALQHRGSIRVARRVRISFLPLDSLE